VNHTDLAPGCVSCEALRKELERARAVIEQLAAQTRIAMNNQAEAMAAIDAFLGLSPDGARLAS
jgi:outer membrane protein TolC